MLLMDAENYIKDAIKEDSPFSHPFCCVVLNTIAEEDGIEEANKLIKKYKLDKIYKIMPVKKRRQQIENRI